MAWATTDEVKTILGISGSSQDARIAALIPIATAWIESYIRRTIEDATYTEIHNGSGRADLVLKHRPIISVTSIKIDSDRAFGVDVDAVATAEYAINEDAGIVTRDGYWPKTNRGIQVVYTAGYETVPQDLVLALADVIQSTMNAVGSSGKQSETIGTYAYTLADVNGASMGMSGTTRATLDSWRDGSILR